MTLQFSLQIVRFIQVYRYNLEWALKQIDKIINDYQYIGLDTEFPGYFDLNNIQPQQNQQEQQTTLIKNVTKLKLIQLGLSFCNIKGEFPDIIAYEFNFQFDINTDLVTNQAKEFLHETLGDTYLKYASECGIDQELFFSLLQQTRLIHNDKLQYFVFHGNQDIGYIISGLYRKNIKNVQDLKNKIKFVFPQIYDVKTLYDWHSGLEFLGINQFQFQRVGEMHNAGSDAHLTLQCALKIIIEKIWETNNQEQLKDNYYALNQQIYGLEEQ